MPFQTTDLWMLAHGSIGDVPPNALQPPLKDGIHLRWAFAAAKGFPWYGYYLFRRAASPEGPRQCLSALLAGRRTGTLPSGELALTYGTLVSDRPLVLTDNFPAAGTVEVDLTARTQLAWRLPAGIPARQAEVTIGFRTLTRPGPPPQLSVRITAVLGGLPVAETVLTGLPGDVKTVTVAASAFDTVTVTGAPAAITELCVSSAVGGLPGGWAALAGLSYPLCLPVARPDYPCPGRPGTPQAAQAAALSRISYGPANAWAGARFAAVHDRLIRLVSGGPPPAGQPMADRYDSPAGTPAPPPEAGGAITQRRQRPLDLLLLGSLNPALAQILGLYWVDATAAPNIRYDYLLLADHNGSLGGSAASALAWLTAGPNWSVVDGFLCSGAMAATAPPLPAPTGLSAYALPGATLAPAGGGPVLDGTNNAGLTWDRQEGGRALVAGAPVLYHVWRADLGTGQAPKEPVDADYSALTATAPLPVGRPLLDPPQTPDRPGDWPPFALHYTDRGRPDGWYAYKVSAVDLFGRHSPGSAPAAWRQWDPPPDPAPWYWQDAGDVVDAAHIRLLDMLPPPPPAGVEAFALDPDDPTVLHDATWQAWRDSLSPAERTGVIGLRVRWRWTPAQQRQAPDTREFRIYLQPAPVDALRPGYRTEAGWQTRLYVVPYGDHVQVDDDGMRTYEVLLPGPGDQNRSGLPLATTLAVPLASALVGVTAADDKQHTPDRRGDPARYGNEGGIGGPATVFRVRRVRPDRPAMPADSADVFASPADYHHRSYYTFRWLRSDHLRTHVYRALDDAVFQADLARRPRPPLSGNDLAYFPPVGTEPAWTPTKRADVAAELNGLNALDPADLAAARTAYGRLTNDGLRVLAGLPGMESAFVQLTPQPLDPDDPRLLVPGPDRPAGPLPAGQRCYVDTLDGRADNRYLYRAAYADLVHNIGPLGLSSAPVRLPLVTPPRAPAVVRLVAGERQVTLEWFSNRERALAAYRIYRTADPAKARDVRLMDLVHTVAVPDGAPADRPATLTWTDTVPGLVTYAYRLAAVDTAGNVSDAAPARSGRAYDQALPVVPSATLAWRERANRTLAQLDWTSDHEVLVQRRTPAGGGWVDLGGWQPPGTGTVRDPFSDPATGYQYRLWARKYTGAVVTGSPLTLEPLA